MQCMIGVLVFLKVHIPCLMFGGGLVGIRAQHDNHPVQLQIQQYITTQLLNQEPGFQAKPGVWSVQPYLSV